MLLLAGCLEAPPASPGAGGPCGSLRALRDDFAGALDPSRWDATNVGVSGGAARLTGPGGGPNAVLDSAAFYRLAGGQLLLDVDAGELAGGVIELSLADTAGSSLVIRVEAGSLTVSSAPAEGGGAILVDRAFDPGQHLWRLREEDGSFFWATSAADTFSEEGPFPLELDDLVRFEIVLEPGAAESAISIASINQGEEELACPAASLTDDFTSLDPQWQVDHQGDCDIRVAGQAVLGYSAQAFCALTTLERFDLRDSSYSVRLLDVGDCAPEPVMRVELGDDQAFELLCDDDAGMRKLVGRSDDGDFANIDFDEQKHRFIRLVHNRADRVLAFQASGGDGVWSQVGVARIDDPAPLASTSLRFYLGGDPTVPGTVESVALDDVGLAP